MILENTIRQASQILKNNDITSHQLDAEIILSKILGVSREFLLTKNDFIITNKIKTKYNFAINRRVKKEPVAYIIGEKEFWSQNFIVNNATLIPRPETELLIYIIVDFFKNKKISILDIGTGTGCILLALLKELKISKGIGIDISSRAIKTAIANSKKMNIFDRSIFKVSKMENFCVGKYDLIVSNPPYIPLRDLKNLSKDVRSFEPSIALNGGIDGLDLIKKVIYKSNELLKRGGLLAMEIGNQQYMKVSRLLKRSGYREMDKKFDYDCNVRCIISTKM